ncbi:MAG TPA: UDP-2,3-diacylglucosamine diphosphatase [Candidatus Contendobacter sp.]|nr:UDP-2,3-diacylglucosamine diphosphatase [Candidatus Contendobacter sp.]
MDSPRFRTLWISDVHLGFKECKAEFLLDFLRQSDCERLYLVGDLIDFWSLRKGGRWPAVHGEVLKLILAKSRAGTRVIYIPGNHDEVARDYFGLRVGDIAIVPEAIHVTADGRRFLVTHGDECDSAVRCGGPLLHGLGDGAYDLLLFLNRWYNRWRRRWNHPYWSLASFLKQRIGGAAAYIARFEAAAAHEAARRGLDGVICGHIHHAALRELNGVLYGNDGDWVESCTALVEYPDGALEILRWSHQQAVVAVREPRRWPEPPPVPGWVAGVSSNAAFDGTVCRSGAG